MHLEALINQTQISYNQISLQIHKYTNRSLAPNMLCMLLVFIIIMPLIALRGTLSEQRRLDMRHKVYGGNVCV